MYRCAKIKKSNSGAKRLIYFCYVLLILAQVTYCSQNIASTLPLHIHMATHTEVPLIPHSVQI